MSTEREFEGQDLEEALAAAATSLAVPVERLDYEVLEEGRRGVFGFGSRRVRVRIREIEALDSPDPGLAPSEAPPRPRLAAVEDDRDAPDPSLDSSATDVEATVRHMLSLMSLDAVAATTVENGQVLVDLHGPDRKAFARHDGELLEAMEFVLNRMARRNWPSIGTIHLRCDGARTRRDEEIVELAREVAAQVDRSGVPQRLHPMNPYERRLVHVTVREFSGLRSRSEGDGFLKRITLEKSTGH